MEKTATGETKRALPYPDNDRYSTHWPGCWITPRHHNCAAAKVYDLMDVLRDCRSLLREHVVFRTGGPSCAENQAMIDRINTALGIAPEADSTPQEGDAER